MMPRKPKAGITPARTPATATVDVPIQLAPRVVLSLSPTNNCVTVSPTDVCAIRAASAPLLAELALRRLAADPDSGGERTTALQAPTAPNTLSTPPPMVLMSDEEVAGYGRDPDAGFGALRTERGLLPLVAMEVDARVAGVSRRSSCPAIRQRDRRTDRGDLHLPAARPRRGAPLPDGGRRTGVDGVVDERGAARAQYDQAIAAGRRAAIAEEERPGVFTLRVGNLMPGETATVRLSLVGPLPVDDGEVTFRFPLVVAPRYIPGTALGGDQAGLGLAADTDLVPDAFRIRPGVLPGSPNPVRRGLRGTMEDGTPGRSPRACTR